MAKLPIIDRMLAVVSPQRALKRARARMALNAVMHFEGAAKSYRTKNWRATNTDANAAANGQLARLRAASRDLVRNNPLAARAKSVVVNAIVGSGIIPGVTAGRVQRKTQINRLLTDHFDGLAIDADGNTNLYGLEALAVGAMFEGGDCIIRRRYRFAADGFPLPFQLQVLEAEYLDDSKTGPLPGGNTVIQGVEFDLIGRRVAYWLFDQHPNGLAVLRNPISRRIDAKDIIHLFRVDRPGQVRGVPWLAPVIVTLNDFAEFKDAQLVRQKIAACFAAFIHDPDFEGDTPQPQGGEGKPEREIDELGPGMIETLPVGKTVSFSDPPSLGEFTAYSDATGRDIAVGVGITFESLTGNLSNVNFTSGRMGRIDMDANVDAWRWLTVIPKLCVRVAEWFSEAAFVETSSREPFAIGWTPARRPLVDPTKEIPAMVKEVRAGFTSRRRKIREMGFDPEEIDAEIQADNEAADKAGFIFDSDPRRVTINGQSQQSGPANTQD